MRGGGGGPRRSACALRACSLADRWWQRGAALTAHAAPPLPAHTPPPRLELSACGKLQPPAARAQPGEVGQRVAWGLAPHPRAAILEHPQDVHAPGIPIHEPHRQQVWEGSEQRVRQRPARAAPTAQGGGGGGGQLSGRARRARARVPGAPLVSTPHPPRGQVGHALARQQDGRHAVGQALLQQPLRMMERCRGGGGVITHGTRECACGRPASSSTATPPPGTPRPSPPPPARAHRSETPTAQCGRGRRPPAARRGRPRACSPPQSLQAGKGGGGRGGGLERAAPGFAPPAGWPGRAPSPPNAADPSPGREW